MRTPPAARRDGHALVARYEALREHVMGSAVCHQAVHGVALLMREGMASWMECVEDESMRDAIIPTAPIAMRIPEGIEQSLIDVVANMAFVAALENAT